MKLNIMRFVDKIRSAVNIDDEEILNNNLTELFEEMALPIAVFEDNFGNRYECWTDHQFDEMMMREDVRLVFE